MGWLRASIGFGTLLACGCPIPISSDTVTRRAIDFVVRDEHGDPIAGARVLLLTGTDPHHQTEGVEEITTDADGLAAFTERIEEIRSFPLMMHGVPFYYWSWCVEAPHPPRSSRAVALHDEGHAEVVLGPDADDRRCVERHGLLHADRNPPRAGLRLQYRIAANATLPIEHAAERTRDQLGPLGVRHPAFAYDVRVEGDRMVVDVGALPAAELSQARANILHYASVELVTEGPFGGGP